MRPPTSIGSSPAAKAVALVVISGSEKAVIARKALEQAKVRGVLYGILQATWGFPQTIAGAAVFLAHAHRPHCRFHGAVVTTWESYKALSLGPFVFLRGPSDKSDFLDDVERPLLVHEYGHTIQSLILGPAYLVVIGLPSVVRMNAPFLVRRRNEKGVSYYAHYAERSANWLGELALGEPSPGIE